MTTDTSITDTTIPETTDTPESTEIPMRVLKRAATSSLSNRSTLGYAIGCDDNSEIFLSLRFNSAAGMFSKTWIPFADIAKLLSQTERITSSTLLPLYANSSRNNAGFMLAVLLGEGLVCAFERHYQRQDFKPFLKHINSLIAASVDLGDADGEPETTEADAPVETSVVEVAEVPAGKRGRPSKKA